MTRLFRGFATVAVFVATVSLLPGCSLLLGGATGAGVGAVAGSTMDSPGGAAAVGGVGGAAGGALVGAAARQSSGGSCRGRGRRRGDGLRSEEEFVGTVKPKTVAVAHPIARCAEANHSHEVYEREGLR